MPSTWAWPSRRWADVFPLEILLYGILGTAVGSFLNVVIDRLPREQGLLRPASRCPECGRRLTPGELIPVISYLCLRGRCRSCGARIPLRVLLVELASGLLFALLWWRYGLTIRLAAYTLYVCILLVIVAIDFEHQLILDVVIWPAIALALLLLPVWMIGGAVPFSYYGLLQPLLSWYVSYGLSLTQIGVLSQLIGGALGGLIFWLIRAVAPQGMGPADVKLAIFCGLITGFPGALAAIAASFVLGGAVGVTLLATGRASRKTALPFAPFLCTTTLIYLLWGDRLLYWYLGY